MIIDFDPRKPLTDYIDVGFWYSSSEPTLPDPRDLVDEGWDRAERFQVVERLNAGVVLRSYRGMAKCRICGANNGSQDLTDGTHRWPSGLAHYLTTHEVRPPAEFVDAVLGRTGGATSPVTPLAEIEAALDELTDLIENSRFGIKVFNANVVVHRYGDAVGWRTVFSIDPAKAAEAIEFLAWTINNDMMRARSMRAGFTDDEPAVVLFAPVASPPMFNPGQQIDWMIDVSMVPTSDAVAEIRALGMLFVSSD